MLVGVISGAGARGVSRRSRRHARIEAAAAGVRTETGPDRDGRDQAGSGTGPSRSLVASGSSPSRGAQGIVRMSAPFIAQLAATYLDARSDGERRGARMPELAGARAGAAYGRTVRLATELEPGFFVSRDF